jgi:hypothetical protein
VCNLSTLLQCSLSYLRLIYTCHAVPMPFSDSAVSFVKVSVVAENIRTASPSVSRTGMLLITTFVELCVLAGRSRMWAGHPHAVSGRLMLIHTYHAATMPFLCLLEPEGSLPHSQVPATCLYPEPTQSSPYPTSHFLKIHFNIIFPSTPGSPQWSFFLRCMYVYVCVCIYIVGRVAQSV